MAKSKKKPTCVRCGKRRYATQESAAGSAWNRVKRGSVPLRVYECWPESGIWHLSKRLSRIQVSKMLKGVNYDN